MEKNSVRPTLEASHGHGRAAQRDNDEPRPQNVVTFALRAPVLQPLQPRLPPSAVPARRHAGVESKTDPPVSARGLPTSVEKPEAESTATVPSPLRISDLHWPGKVDPNDLKHAEVVHYHWQLFRSQMTEFKAELKELRKVTEDLQVKTQLFTEGKDSFGDAVQQVRVEMREVNKQLTTDVQRLHSEVCGRHTQLDEEVRLAIRDFKVVMDDEYRRIKEDQERLRERCADRAAVEVAQARLDQKIMDVGKEDQLRYSQFKELVDLQFEDLVTRITREHEWSDQQSQHLIEELRRVELGGSGTEPAWRRTIARVSMEHHARQDDLNHTLKLVSEDLKRRISDEVGKCVDAYSKDHKALEGKFDDALEELDVKIAEVEALYSEASHRRAEALSLRGKAVM